MQFDRLRLTGFKSFVDPTDFLILEGLTGIVGPNGCGKSNLLEALRWVMGENRPTAMRGSGMEDVIFAGTARRPARAMAEVALLVDNRDRRAPAGLNDADRIEITRRITRDAGSAYRLNGREVRARDVQMLFADASTGAHSPALVRQGQIAELINARPQARRRILEEAAGISGLYQRRHEATLKLDAAEANLKRVDEVLEGLAAQAAALARQARAAARYREVGAALRLAEGRLLWRRWSEAEDARAAAEDASGTALREAMAAEAASRRVSAARESAEAALPALREEDSIAAALHARMVVERESLDAAEARAAEAVTQLRARFAQLDRDLARETGLNRDAGDVIARLEREATELGAAAEGEDDHLAAAQQSADNASAALRVAETALGLRQDEAAGLAARHQSAERLAADLTASRDRAARAATETEGARARARATGQEAATALQAAEAGQTAARLAAEAAEGAVTQTESQRTQAEGAEAAARAARAAAEGEASALKAEVAALERALARTPAAGRDLLDGVRVDPGAETAFAAALGNDLSVGAGQGDGPGWRALPPLDPAPLPSGAQPLSASVAAPQALARRIAATGIVTDAAAGRAGQAALVPGQRLVSREGEVWHWDGLVQGAGTAASAAALHLQTVNRLAAARLSAADAEARAAEALAAHEAARAMQTAAAKAEAAAREARRTAERDLSEAARAATRAESDRALALTRAEAAEGELSRHRTDAADAATRLAEAEALRAVLPDRAVATAAVDAARTGAEAARLAFIARRAAADDLRREVAARGKRRAEVATEAAGWRQRLAEAAGRAAELEGRRSATAAELAQAEAEPARLAQQRVTLAQSEGAALTRAGTARAALGTGDATLRDAQAAEREAERAASTAREVRAARDARAEAAREAEAAARARIHDETGAGPEALAGHLQSAPEALPDGAALESEIARLRAARESLGAVNLRAEEDRRTVEDEREALDREKIDLESAIRKLRGGIGSLNREGRERLLAAFDTVNANFRALFTHLFGGGEARLVLVESDDPLEAGLEIMCQPPGKKLSTLSLLSGGEQTLTALALISAVFLANPAPICVLDEVDAPLDDANVTRFCDLLDEMTRRTQTRFVVITHHAVTMARMDRLFGVTMVEQGVSQLVSVDLRRAEALVA